MLQLVGFMMILVVVAGGLMISGGPAVLAALPFELALIGGAAFGTVLLGNAPSVAKAALMGLGKALRGPHWRRQDYTDLMALMHELTRRAQRGGIVAIEAEIEDPHTAPLFQNTPRLLASKPAIDLICESFRLIALDPANRRQIGPHLQSMVAGLIEERQRAVSALRTLADALPALGIVAAVLGIIKTMGVIDQSPAVLGEMIAAALLGTFLGVFLAYGLVGPLAERYSQIVDEDALYFDTIARIISGFSEDLAPRTNLELARAALPVHVRPDLNGLDQAVSAVRFTQNAQAA